jgi:peptidoglycan lytic transglycosylase G
VRVLLYLFWVAFVGAVIGGVAVFWFSQEISVAASDTAEPVAFRVQAGATGRSVAAELEEKGLIVNALAFRLLLSYYERRQGAALRAGYFMVDPQQDIKGVLDSLLHGETLTRKATIPEGFVKKQVAESLEEQGIVKAADFWDALKTTDLGWDKFPDRDLEGYLFPSTYEFPYECTGEEAVLQMTGQFRATVEPMLEKYQNTKPLSLQETVVLASLVEREAQVASERPLIAGVYINRIKKGMKLECDATVQFALGKQKAVLLYSDLEINSPYNTYRFKGLPPGPICSPGAASLDAAFSPKTSDYLFYVRNDVKNDGSHVFGRNYAEHQANIAKYQK